MQIINISLRNCMQIRIGLGGFLLCATGWLRYHFAPASSAHPRDS